MRAPPLAVKHTKGNFCSTASSTPRTKRSPTTDPIEPPMKSNSNAATTTGRVRMAPCSTTSASVSLVDSIASLRRSGYLRLSLNFRVSSGRTSEPISKRPSGSSKPSSRSRAPMRWWWAHFGHTCALLTRSVAYRVASQAGHLTQTPSGTLLCGPPSARLILGGSNLSIQLMRTPCRELRNSSPALVSHAVLISRDPATADGTIDGWGRWPNTSRLRAAPTAVRSLAMRNHFRPRLRRSRCECRPQRPPRGRLRCPAPHSAVPR